MFNFETFCKGDPMNPKTLIVAPYPGIKHIVDEIIEEKSLKNIHTVVGDLEKGLEIALQEFNQGAYDLIISRGGTANLLKNKTNIPILEIPISTTDIMQAIRMVENYDGNYVIIGYENIVNKAKQVCELLNCAPPIYTIKEPNDAKILIKKLQSEGYDLIIGDVITTNYCSELGVNSILVTTSKDTIESVLNQSTFLKFSLNSTKQLYDKCFEYHKNKNEFCLIYSQTGSLIVSSIKTEDIPTYLVNYIDKNKALLSSLQFYQDNIKSDFDHVSLISKQIAIEETRYLLIAVKIVNIHNLNINGFKIYDKLLLEETNGKISLNFFEASRKQIQDSMSVNSPVLVKGEPFTGKTSCITYLFSTGPFNNNLLYVFDLALLSLDNFQIINTIIDFKSLTESALCFLNLQDCNLNLLRLINSLLLLPNIKDNMQIFFSLTCNQKNIAIQSKRIEQLNNLENFSVIELPALRDRKNEFNNLLTLYISNYNITLGTNIISLTDEAREKMELYNWPGNLKQFKRVIRKAMLLSNDNYYVNDKTIIDVLAEEEAYGYINHNVNHILLKVDDDLTLDEIIYKLVKKKLERSNFNQKKVAEQLNISRTTVWRILKEN